MKRRWLALFLSFAMIFSLTVSAYAENYGDGNISHGTSYEEDDESGSSSVASDSDASEGQDSELQDTADEESGDHNSGDTNPEDSSDSGNKGGTDKDNPSDAESGDSSDIGNTSSGENGKASDSGNDGKTEDIDQGTDGAGDSSETGEAETASDSDATEGETTTASDSDATKDACKECGLTEGHSKECSKYVPQCTCGAEDGNHAEGCELYEAPVYSEICQKLLAADSLTEMHEIMFHEANESALMALSDEEVILIAERISELYTDEEDELEIAMMEFLMMNYPVAFGLPAVLNTDYIYFDLYYGDVEITASTYKGYVWNGASTELASGNHEEQNKYYIFQSNPEQEKQGVVSSTTVTIPEYDRVAYGGKTWGEHITDNTDVLGVIEEWENAAEDVGRAPTEPVESNKNEYGVPMAYRISISGDSIFDVTLDNVWSGFHNDDMKLADITHGEFPGNYNKEDVGLGLDTSHGPHYRYTGGLSFRPGVDSADTSHHENTYTEAAKLYVHLKGDNRFGNIHYENGSGAGGTTTEGITATRIEQMFFDNVDDEDNPATLTVANLGGDNGYNHFCSVIGGANNPNYVPGLVFNGGIVYAGATVLDNCTAIGGGGCGFGGVTINDGTVTAVTATNGAAIGGGIGDGSNGGAADVLITGGEVYAYNKGLAIEGTRETGSSGNLTGTDAEIVYAVMPAVAIGSGSSRRQWTVPAKIDITGGTVYAESIGGTAIGGGSSVNFDGSSATINITGGTVTAKSCSGKVQAIHEYDGGQFPTYIMENGDVKMEGVKASTSIGGGTAGIPFRYDKTVTPNILHPYGSGGNAELTITGEETKIYAGSIGGGGTSDPREYGEAVGKIGAAHVTISNGLIQGQVIMAKGAEEDCSFTMTGGTIDNSGMQEQDPNEKPFTFLKENGGAVYVENGSASMTGGTITGASAVNGGAFYVIGGSFALDGGTIEQCIATQNGGAIYIDTSGMDSAVTTISDGTIQDNTADGFGGGIYQTGPVNSVDYNCIVEGTGKIIDNRAANGGGIYVTGGSALQVTGGEITGNSAVGTPENSDSGAFNNAAECGVGGGIYVANGMEGRPSKFSMSGDAVGLYGNEASYAAADAYASGVCTDLDLPKVAGMSLSGVADAATATGWFADYSNQEPDSNYPQNIIGSNNNGRYIFANPGNVEVSEIVDNEAYASMFYCLKVGTGYPGYGSLTIEKIVGHASAVDETFIFDITSEEKEPQTVLTVTIKVPAGQTRQSIIISALPDGEYSVVERQSNWRYDMASKTLFYMDENQSKVEQGTVKIGIHSSAWTGEFTNAFVDSKWIDGETTCQNIFKTNSIEPWIDGIKKEEEVEIVDND